MNSRRVLLGVGLLILLLTINASMAFVSMRDLAENNRRVATTHAVLAKLEDVHSLLQSAESSKQRCLLGNDSRQLVQVLTIVGEVDDRLNELREATGGNLRHQARLDQLQGLANDQLRELKEIEARRANLANVRELFQARPDRKATDQIGHVIREMRGEEESLLEQHEGRCVSSLMGAKSALALSSLADFALLALACCLIRRDARIREASERSLRDYAEALEIANRNLSRFCQAAEAATRAKSEFLANMSHEIRTPMMAILGHADLLLSERRDFAQLSNSVLAIQRNGEHLLQLINDILDLSKIEAGKLSIERTRCSPFDVLNDVRSMMEARAAGRKLSFELACAGPVPACILTDSTRLRQILINLVGNAIKFTERGSVRVVCRFVPEQAHAAPRMCFDVIDTGIGIERDKLEHLFQPFVQADSSTTRRFGGTGLGLFISRHLAEALGGTIEAQSSPGAGSRFTLSLDPGPLDGMGFVDESDAAFEPPSAPEEEELSAAETALLDHRRVLLADDGTDNQYLISLHLRTAGMEIDVVDNGRLAVDRVWKAARSPHPYDLVLMDMQMPELDGYSATARLRQAGYQGTIVALTAHAMEGDRDKCLTAGCDDYVSKPITRMGLLRTIAAHLAMRAVSGSEPAAQAATEEDAPPADCPAPPLASTFADDPRMTAAIDRFVSRLPERVEALVKAAASGDRDTLVRETHQLKGAAGGYGFAPLTAAAAVLEEELRLAGAAAELDLPALRELVELCRRAAAPQPRVSVERDDAPNRAGD